jgi:hypothetical protein
VEYLPIGIIPGGILCIGLKGENRGRIFAWDREEDFEEPERNLSLVALSFDAFMKSLKPVDRGK